MIKENYVVISKENIFTYPHPPYNPPEISQELKSLPYKVEIDPSNRIYELVRKALFIYGMDNKNYGTKNWSPFSEIIEPGMTVIIKPNLVTHKHPLGNEALLSSITHASIVRPIIDYTLLALSGKGKIIVCDGPLEPTDFNMVCEISGLKKLISFYNSKLTISNIQLLDLRETMLHPQRGVIQLKGDPLGYSLVDLGDESLHTEIDSYWKKYRENLRKYHTYNKHFYVISNTALSADAIISIPKLKTHKKAGITVAMKNFLGFTSQRDSLPHCRKGTPIEGGDEWPYRFKSSISDIMEGVLLRILAELKPTKYFSSFNKIRKLVRQLLLGISYKNNFSNLNTIGGGMWYGNDTL